MSEGYNYFKWTVTNNMCVEHVDVTVISNQITEPYAGLDQVICVDSAKLNANEAKGISLGVWSVRSGSGVFEDVNSPNSMVYGIAPGRNVLNWTFYYGGDGSNYQVDSVVIINNRPYPVNAYSNPITSSDCELIEADLLHVGSGSWEVISGESQLFDAFNPITDVCNLEYGENIIRWTATHNNCVDYTDITIERVLTTDIENNKKSEISIYPTPVIDEVFIESTVGIKEVSILSIAGEQLFKSNIENKTKTQISMTDFQSGAYIIQIKMVDKKVENLKIIKK